MKSNIKKLAIIASSAAVIAWSHGASACAKGYTCFGDYATGAKGRVQYNNDNWGNFGWNNRADWFQNKGHTYNNCLYDGYNQKGTKFLLRRGQTLYTAVNYGGTSASNDPYFRNRVSSNKWTNARTTSGCPNQ